MPGDMVAWLHSQEMVWMHYFSSRWNQFPGFVCQWYLGYIKACSYLWWCQWLMLKWQAHPNWILQEGITVSCWIKPTTLPEKESFIPSHGSWQNRWKFPLPRNVYFDGRSTQYRNRRYRFSYTNRTNKLYLLPLRMMAKSIMIYVNGSLTRL